MLMIQSWEELLTHLKSVLLFSRSWAGWRDPALLLGKNNHMYQYRLEDDLLERSSVERDLSVLVDNRLAVSL